jgi:hypothetical protein
MTEFYTVTQSLCLQIPALFVKLEPHDPGDPESSDLLWTAINGDQEALYEGDVIKIAHYGNQWFADHDEAHKVGGWPTVWSTSGSADEVVAAVVAYLVEE